MKFIIVYLILYLFFIIFYVKNFSVVFYVIIIVIFIFFTCEDFVNYIYKYIYRRIKNCEYFYTKYCVFIISWLRENMIEGYVMFGNVFKRSWFC